MKTKNQRQLNSYTVLDDKEYTRYREYDKLAQTHRIKGRPNYKKFVNTYFKVIADELLEREGGVCIKGFGYWWNWMPPKKVIGGRYTVRGLEEMYSFVTDHHLYLPTFWATDRLVWWCMDKTFNVTYKKKLKDKIKAGKTYKMYLASMKQLKYL
jgi:hypothetical protein